MRRRTFLAGIGATCLGAASGCGGQSDEPTATATETPTATATETPTATATETPTATATETSTPAPEPVTHSIGERFVVDPGNEPFAYTVHELLRADRLITRSAAEGTVFLVAICTVENLQREPAVFPEGNVWLRAATVRKSVSVSASDTAGQDPRLGPDSLTDSQLFPDTPRRGVIAFPDAPIDPTDYRILFTPPGTTGPTTDDPTDTHLIPVGSLRDVEAIA